MLLQVMCLSTSRLEHPNPPSESLLCSLIKGVFGTTSPSFIPEKPAPLQVFPVKHTQLRQLQREFVKKKGGADPYGFVK